MPIYYEFSKYWYNVVHYFFRGESDDEDDPFRVWFSKIGELRSLYSSASIAALTATSGPVQRRKIMKLLCLQANSTIILESPDRKNIKISSQCIPNNENLQKVFHWLIEDLKKKKEKLPRHIIFCERIQDVSKIYTLFVKIFVNNCDLFDMFHSKSSEKVKDKIRKDMNTDGTIRIFVCTNAAGMGVNFHGVNNIIHFNLPRQMDTFVQQMGRAGRDGGQSHNLILYKTHKGHLKRVDPV